MPVVTHLNSYGYNIASLWFHLLCNVVNNGFRKEKTERLLMTVR